MKLQRLHQIIDGNEAHYVLINHFKIIEKSSTDDLQQFALDFINSDYFKHDCVADSKKARPHLANQFLSFPFEIKKLTVDDFKIIEGNAAAHLLSYALSFYNKNDKTATTFEENHKCLNHDV